MVKFFIIRSNFFRNQLKLKRKKVQCNEKTNCIFESCISVAFGCITCNLLVFVFDSPDFSMQRIYAHGYPQTTRAALIRHWKKVNHCHVGEMWWWIKHNISLSMKYLYSSWMKFSRFKEWKTAFLLKFCYKTKKKETKNCIRQ